MNESNENRYISILPIFEGFGVRKAIKSLPFPFIETLLWIQDQSTKNSTSSTSSSSPSSSSSLPPFLHSLILTDLARLALDSLRDVPIDLRAVMARNVLPIGGLAMHGRSAQQPLGVVGPLLLQGMAGIIEGEAEYGKEMKALLPSLRNTESLVPTAFYWPDTVAWSGASILASVFPEDLSLSSFEPDGEGDALHHWAKCI